MKFGIGLMSGTSLDGIDVALVQIEGSKRDTKVKLVAFDTFDIANELKEKIKLACDESKATNKLICSLNFELGYAFSDAVMRLCKEHDFPIEKVDFIASHGQTIYHLPVAEKGFFSSTMQIGEAAVIAYQTNVPVISNFRVMDMAAGGEGAPLVPYSEYVLYAAPGKVTLLQNIGGIGNVTVVTENIEDMLAFDTGPGNMIMDEVCVQLFNVGYDRGGELALKGKVNIELLDELMKHDYLNQLPPKSTGREMFGQQFTTDLIKRYSHLDKHDLLATVTIFTAQTIVKSYQDFIFNNFDVDQVVVGGGGAYNQVLMNHLKAMMSSIHVCTQEDLGFSSAAKEAIAFVVLANETLYGQPSNVIASTHAKEYVVLGQITPSPRGGKQ